ncbi:hypothetical protein MO973_08425 [Paenibacillus sp. TRM 82003]|nr:hypothetical protein [Paenibacillus sp. TRM 82003]
MRMGFVVGGLVGAAAAMYFNRNNRTFSFSSIGNAGQALDSVVEKARSRMMSPDKRSYYGDQSNASGSMSGANASASTMSGMSGTSGASDLQRVENIVKEDPALKSQVNEILTENRDTATIR